ncbi:AfsR/SARP family transcriptional regulator [Micromonospora musae]|uniref:AfsR/SARP family transcriptional regulator n=1 Tax=Micromonospora musae TaxID=1894970 RepID=UPI003446EC14
MEFGILGPLSIRSGPSSIHLSGDRNRKLLAALVLNVNRAVPIDRLIDVVWDEQPPATARQQVQNRLGQLRSMLALDDTGQRIIRHGTSYVLEAAEERVDAFRFRAICAEANSTSHGGEFERAIGLLRDALSLWRGPVIQDITSPTLNAEKSAWEEAKLRAVERLVTLEFARGHHSVMIPDLHAWARQYPYHEKLHCHLAEALHTGSRTAESLQVLARLRATLRDELGIDAGQEVHELEGRLTGRQEEFTAPVDVPVNLQAVEALQRALTETTRALQLLQILTG